MKIQDVLNKPGRSSFFVNLKLKKSVSTADARTAFAEFCEHYPAVLRSMRIRYPMSNLKSSFGLSHRFWTRLLPEFKLPNQLREFKEIKGENFTAPATPGDLFIHLRAEHADYNYETLRQLMEFLHPFMESEYEIHGFSYLDGRAIIGFVDGTENPEGDELFDSVVIEGEDPDYRNGSYLFTQKYIHDMDAWNSLSTDQQEKTIGRRKFDDVELSDDEKYPNAHNAISQAHDADGNELKIRRANVIFAHPSRNEYGTFFISYSRYFDTVQMMLENMFLGTEEHGTHDKLLEFSTAKTGTLFFVPGYDLIERFTELEV